MKKFDFSRYSKFAGAFLFALALLVRLIYLWQAHTSPFFASPILDAEVYDQEGWRIAQGNWLGDGVFFQAPLYSYFLGIIYFIFGHNYLLPRLVQAVLGAFSALLLYRLGRRVFNEKIGLLAGLIFSLNGPLIYFTGELLVPTLYIFLLLLFLLKLDHLLERPGAGNYLLSGLLLGLAALARPTALILLPIALLWIIFRLQNRWRGFLLFAAGTALVILLVTARNYLVGKDLVLISSQAGVNFFMGNNSWSNGHTAWVPGTPRDWWAEGFPETNRIAEREAGRKLRPSQISAFWRDRTLRDIGQNPAGWGKLMLKKLHLLLAGHEISNTEDIYYQRRFSGLLGLLMWEGLIAFPFGLILPLALLGLALKFSWRRQSHLLLFGMGYAVTIVLFFVTARYRLALVPVLCLWSAAGIYETLDIIRQKRFLPYILTFLSFAALVILLNRNPLKGEEISYFDGAMNVGNKYLVKGQYAEALGAFQEAQTRDPAAARAASGAAAALLKLGQPEKAKLELEKAVLYEPSLIPAQNNLGRLLLEEGNPAQAEKHFEAVLRLDSSNVTAQRGLADVAWKRGDYPLAEAHYQRAHDLGATDKQVMTRWAEALWQQGKYAEALQINTQLLAALPNDARVHYNQACLYIACDSTEQAAGELETVLRLDPKMVEAGKLLAEIRGRK